MARANQRNDHPRGGNASSALSLNAANVTTTAGSSRKPRMASTATVPPMPSSRWKGERGMSMRPQIIAPHVFQRTRRDAHQRQDRQREREAGDAQARGERKVEAGEAELIDQVRDHVDPAAADQ